MTREFASMLLGAALARMRSLCLVHAISYGSVLRKRHTRARIRAHVIDAQAYSLVGNGSFAPFGTRSVRDEAS
jgi:hypothetical protein